MLTASCSTNRLVRLKLSISNDLVSQSIFDFSKTKAKDYRVGSVFYVSMDTLQDKLVVSISKSDAKYRYKDENQIHEKPIRGKFLEINKRLYHLNSYTSQKSADFTLAIEYGLIVFDKIINMPWIDDFNDDLQKVMYYIYCKYDNKINIKLYTNDLNVYYKSRYELNCNKN